jgi:hypothetical protein
MDGFTRKHLTGPLAEVAERLSQFLKRHGLAFETVAAHLRLGILSPRESWALRKFGAISGASGERINDLASYLVAPALQSIVPQVATASITGTAVDMIDADGPCFGILCVGAVSAGTTAATLNLKYTECATAAGTYADIAGATHTPVTASSKFEIKRFMRSQRFVKAVGTMSGTSPSIAFTAIALGQKKNV